MELRNLISFIHVAELGSFTKAAEQLGYSQSTISFQIKQLEDELDCLLFDRINHTITLTERGRDLLSYAHEVRTLTDRFNENLKKNEEISGNIHLVTPDSICKEMIYAHFTDFHSKYPHINIKVTAADTAIMFEMLDRNEADVIITLDTHSYKKDYVIAKEELLPMHFVCGTKSKFAGKRHIKVKDIVGEPFVLTESAQGYRRVLDKHLATKSLYITPVLEIGRTDIITHLLKGSDMISYLPDFVTRSAVESGEICYLDVCDVDLEIWKQLIYHKNKWLSKSLKAFIRYISENDFTQKES